MVQCGVGGIPTGCAKGHLFNPAPRIGFAWDPWGDGKTAIRGGYGIFYEHTNGNEAVATALEGSPPLVQNPAQQSIATQFGLNGVIQTSGYSQVGGNTGDQFPLSVVSIPNKQVWPYVQQWHFDIQHEFGHHFLGVVSYVGSKGTHLGQRFDLNQIPSTPASSNPYKPGELMNGGTTTAIDPVTMQPVTVAVHDDCGTGTTPSGVQYRGITQTRLPPTSSGTRASICMSRAGMTQISFGRSLDTPPSGPKEIPRRRITTRCSCRRGEMWERCNSALPTLIPTRLTMLPRPGMAVSWIPII